MVSKQFPFLRSSYFKVQSDIFLMQYHSNIYNWILTLLMTESSAGLFALIYDQDGAFNIVEEARRNNLALVENPTRIL